jgi:putative FmdB family regulatory protein
MPTYNYRCAACGHEFERVQRITEEALRHCPSCNLPSIERLILSGNFILKGSGWYADHYAGGSNKKADGKTDGKTEGKAEGKTEAKSESKADATPTTKDTASPTPAASAPASTPGTSSGSGSGST